MRVLADGMVASCIAKDPKEQGTGLRRNKLVLYYQIKWEC